MLIAVLVGAFLWWRSRRRNISLRGLPFSSREENIPLTQNGESYEPPDDENRPIPREPKGKERTTTLTPKEEIFRVEDSDDEDHDGGGKSPRS